MAYALEDCSSWLLAGATVNDSALGESTTSLAQIAGKEVQHGWKENSGAGGRPRRRL